MHPEATAERTAAAIDALAIDALAIDRRSADLLFLDARTVNAFDGTDVEDAAVRAAYDLVRWGPTAMNSQPLRLALVRSGEARAALAEHLAPGNRAKTMAAPLTIVAAADPGFHEHLPFLAPHQDDAFERFEAAGPEGRAAAARTSALIQVGYLIVGLRAAGLDVGPVGGFDAAGVDAELFAATGWRSLLILNVGTAALEGASYPRRGRLDFDQVSVTL